MSFRGYSLAPFDITSEQAFYSHLRHQEAWEPYSWFGYGGMARMAGSTAHRPAPDLFHLKVESSAGDMVGRVTWTHGGQYGARDEQRPWSVGVLILPAYRGSSAAYAGLTLLIDYLFTTTSVNRIESTTSGTAHFKPRRGPGGLQYEGTLRGAQWRDGKWHDVTMYGVTRTDWLQPRGHHRTPTV